MTRREAFKPFDVTEYLGSPEDRAAYLRAMWEDIDGDVALLATALGDVARAMGMSQIARETGVAREALYKALSQRGNPELATLVKVLRTLGLELSVRAARNEGRSVESPESTRVGAASALQRDMGHVAVSSARGRREAHTGRYVAPVAGKALRGGSERHPVGTPKARAGATLSARASSKSAKAPVARAHKK